MTILPTGKHLRQTISKIVDSADSIIKIRTFNNQVRVNHRTISQSGCKFIVSNRKELFFLKKILLYIDQFILILKIRIEN